MSPVSCRADELGEGAEGISSSARDSCKVPEGGVERANGCGTGGFDVTGRAGCGVGLDVGTGGLPEGTGGGARFGCVTGGCGGGEVGAGGSVKYGVSGGGNCSNGGFFVEGGSGGGAADVSCELDSLCGGDVDGELSGGNTGGGFLGTTAGGGDLPDGSSVKYGLSGGVSGWSGGFFVEGGSGGGAAVGALGACAAPALLPWSFDCAFAA